MAQLNPKELKEFASQRLHEATFDPKKLVLIHTGVIVLLNLVVNGLNLYLNQQIGTTGGLGGLGLRSVLQTAQTILGYIATFFSPFWFAGFLFATVSIVRGNEASPASLLQGFRRFGRILSYVFWQMLILISLCVALMYLISFLYMMTPFADGVMRILEPVMSNPELLLPNGMLNMELVPVDELMAAMLPMLLIYFAAVMIAYAYVGYQLRMGTFLLVEGIERGSFGAIVVGPKMMRGHKWQMLKLDLSFWWYYALEFLLTLVLYLDVLLPMLGVQLPVNETVAYFISLIVYGLLELGLHLWKRAYVDVTYAAAYEAIYQEALPKES